MNVYQKDFYRDRHEKTIHSAETILSIILDVIPTVHSAVDVGCGVGTWLSVLKNRGIEEIQGIDGSWVDKEFLQISVKNFMVSDLNQPITLDRKFDMAISLEVAEHLPEVNAPHFVSSLTKLADFVLFSAAIPNQGGKNHINEQWPEYWNNLFNKCGYIGLDIVRRKIWNDSMIPFWYRQNIILFALKERVPELKLKYEIGKITPISMVHPELYSLKMSYLKSYSNRINNMTNEIESVKGSYKLLLAAIKRKISQKTKFSSSYSESDLTRV